MQLKRLIYFLLLNILVSAATTLAVLNIWDRTHETDTIVTGNLSPQVVIPTATQGIEDQMEVVETPEIQLQAYQVSAGETLGEIAFEYGMTLEELLVLNGLSDPDSIGAGTTIFVPSNNQSVSGNETQLAAAEGEGGLEGVDTQMGGDQVEIVAVIGVGDLGSERVQLRGISDVALPLTGWRLQDEDGNSYTFPQITLFGSGAVDVYSTRGVDTVVALYWNSSVSIWETGETVTLMDNDGSVQATYVVP